MDRSLIFKNINSLSNFSIFIALFFCILYLITNSVDNTANPNNKNVRGLVVSITVLLIFYIMLLSYIGSIGIIDVNRSKIMAKNIYYLYVGFTLAVIGFTAGLLGVLVSGDNSSEENERLTSYAEFVSGFGLLAGLINIFNIMVEFHKYIIKPEEIQGFDFTG